MWTTWKKEAYIFPMNSSLEKHQYRSLFKRRWIATIKSSNHMFVRCNNIFINIRNLSWIPSKIRKKQHRRTQFCSCKEQAIRMVSHDQMIFPSWSPPFLPILQKLHQSLLQNIVHAVSFIPMNLGLTIITPRTENGTKITSDWVSFLQEL